MDRESETERKTGRVGGGVMGGAKWAECITQQLLEVSSPTASEDASDVKVLSTCT